MRGGKWTASAMAALVLFSSYGTAFGAEAPAAGQAKSDIKGHWAESQIADWMSRGLVTGYTDGSFKPNGQITRAEFFALINRSFGFTEKENVKFGDLPAGSWAYDEVSKAVKAGYVSGYGNGSVGAADPISRQEAAVIVARLLDLKGDAAGADFSDADKFASWADQAIRAVSASDIMRGSSGRFSPGLLITRGEAVVTLDRAGLAYAASQANRKYDAAGTYGPASGKETVAGSVSVNVPGVTLKNMVIEGDLILGEGIGSGDAFLDGIEVKGRVLVHGGGENSIHFNDSVLVDVIIDKASGFGTVRIVSEGTTTVAMVIVNSPAFIQEAGSTAAGFGNVNVNASLPAGSKVTLQGSFETLNVSAKQIQVDLPEGTVKNLNAAATASDLSLNLNAGTTVNSLVLNAIVKVLGRGTIVAAVMNTGGSTFQTPPQTSSGSGASTPAVPAPVTPNPAPSVPSNPAPTNPNNPTNPTTPSVPAVDTGALSAAIAAGGELLQAHPSGEMNGSVAVEAYDAYKNAIQAAHGVLGNTASTQAQINAAVEALSSATNVFRASFIVVDTSALSAAIAEAGMLLDAHPIGEANGNVSQDTHDALASAIKAADSVLLDASKLTQGRVQAALDELSKAVAVFQGEGSIIVVDTKALNEAVTSARQLLAEHPVGEANGNVTDEVYADFESAVQLAAVVLGSPASTQPNVYEALDRLAVAQSAFQGQYVIVNLEELKQRFNASAKLLGQHAVGEANGEVPASAAEAMRAVLEQANRALTSPASTQAQVDAFVAALAKADQDFKASIIVKVNIQADSSRSSGLPMIRVTELPAGANRILVYDGQKQIGSANSNGPTASVSVDYLTPGMHTLTVQVTNGSMPSAIASNVLNYEALPAAIRPASQFSAGSMHGVTLSVTGSVYTWGYNNAGQIGDGTKTIHPAIYDVPGLPTGIIAVQAGFDHTMILTQDGKVWKWGRGAGMLPAQVSGLDHIVAIGSEGGTLEVALKSDGTVLYMESYGTRKNMELTDVKAIVGTYASAYALKTDGTVWAWGGYNENGQLGNDTTTGSQVPVRVLGLPANVAEIRGGNQHGVALTEDGDVYAWGFNQMGQIGNGTLTNSLHAIKVEGLPKITLIGTGNYSTFAKGVDGKVYAWGAGYNGQLGLGHTNHANPVPQAINYNLSKVVAISGGGSNTTFALMADGRVMSWGSGSYGMLGDGAQSGGYRLTPGTSIPNINLFGNVIED
ncbi:S-layer homology domain-containing protein [Saccharibacillus brassicae]|nr:S-layer homology domain-containing protein [Saccharibacillus brassicae]